MRLVTFEHGNRRALGAVMGDAVVDLRRSYARYLAEVEQDPQAEAIAAVRIPDEMTGLIAGLEPAWRAAELALEHAAVSHPLEEVVLHAPLVPPVILNSGQNYWDHREEKPPVEQHDPQFFLKSPLAVIGPADPRGLDPLGTGNPDHEVGLGGVSGKRVRP